LGRAGQFQDARRIAFEITDGRIELGQGYLHQEEIAYEGKDGFSITSK
jgi:hypothetical protein